MSSLATFCDVPVSAIFDDNAAHSCVSLDWVIDSGLRTHNSQASGPSLASDLVLGLDWFQFVQHTALEGIVHLSSGPLDIRRRPPLPAFATPGSHETLSYIHPLSAAPMLRGGIGGNPSSSSSVSRAGPDVVSAYSGPPDASYTSCPTTSYAGWNATYAWCCF
ncbi:hypothetical protein B0H13DRAFT_2345481 [Mycena leptocephala]|nr:hypothetical protein B0H13DRAFT_2345481 [Mycena leptocephala]